MSHAVLADTLMDDFSELPKSKKKTDLDDYAIINVSPSVIPSPYLPSFRIFAYNVTGLPPTLSSQDDDYEVEKKKKKEKKKKHDRSKPDVDCNRKENKKKWECRPKKPQHADPESPSRSNKLWTPLGYAQVSKIRGRHQNEILIESI